MIARTAASDPPVVLSGVSNVTGLSSLNVTPSFPQMSLASLKRLVQLVPVGEASAAFTRKNTAADPGFVNPQDGHMQEVVPDAEGKVYWLRPAE